MSDVNKIHFIICYNDEISMQECMRYLSFLHVPDGIETEVIGIAGAESVAGAYQAAMCESDATYKVYLRQDVLITNKYFISDVIQTFQENPKFGMLGVLGSSRILEDADYWEQWDTGMAQCYSAFEQYRTKWYHPKEVKPVEAVCGMLIVTRYDLPWREDLLHGSYFYDIAQSVEFQKAGYQTGIVSQETAWCSYSDVQRKAKRYEADREVFCMEYRAYGYRYQKKKTLVEEQLRVDKVEEMLSLFEKTLLSGEAEKAKALIDKTMEFYNRHEKLWKLRLLSRVMLLEKVLHKKQGFCCQICTIHETLDQLGLYRFLLLRLQYDQCVEDLLDVLEWAAQKEEETLAVAQLLARDSGVDLEKVMEKLAWFMRNKCNKNVKIHIEHQYLLIPGEKELETARSLCSYIDSKILDMSTLTLIEAIGNEKKIKETGKVMLDYIYHQIEAVNRVVYIAGWTEKFYPSYMDAALENKKVQIFLEECREWLEQVKHYLDRSKKDDQPLVSVILAVYNGETFIEDTLRSVMEQSYKNLQIIVVDDASTDHSRKVIDRLAREDLRIEKIYLEENQNICAASNTGYQKARGKYIAPLGHDDIWKQQKLEKQVQFMEMNTSYGACFTLCDLIDDEKQICNDKCLHLYQIFNQQNRTQEEWVETLFYFQNVFCASSALIRKECLKEKVLYRNGLLQLQDYALWLEIIVNAPFYLIQERLTLYRQFLKSNGNLSTLDEKKSTRLIHENSFIQKDLLEKMPDEKFCRFFRKHFLYKDAVNAEELKCERAFILKNVGNCHCIDLFIEFMESEQMREVLKRNYHFGYHDFYELSAQTMPYDNGSAVLSSNLAVAAKQIHKYRKLLEAQQSNAMQSGERRQTCK